MAFTAQDVKTLREKTGCGMMDCKKALTQANGDMDAAIDFLREQGLAKQAKKASRIAAEGVAYACTNDTNTEGVVIEVNAETDFVAKNDSFQAFVKTCADTVMAQNPADVDALLALKAEGSEMTVAELIGEFEKNRGFYRKRFSQSAKTSKSAVLTRFLHLALLTYTQAEKSAFL